MTHSQKESEREVGRKKGKMGVWRGHELALERLKITLITVERNTLTYVCVFGTQQLRELQNSSNGHKKAS